MDIDKLQKELQEKVASLEKQRQREAEEFEVLKAKREQEIADQKAAWQAEYRKKEAARLARESAQREAWEAQQKADRDAKIALEQEQEKAAQATRDYEDRLRKLENDIARVEHAEEQRKQVLAATVAMVSEGGARSQNEEEITDGVWGLEPDNAEMSVHLRRILRQQNRNY
jgi:colicin import membrane protein